MARLRLRRIFRWLLLSNTVLIGVIVLLLVLLYEAKFQWLLGSIHRVYTSRKVVALTFDDGPHPLYTPEILDILAVHHIKATFFMIGERMERYPEVVKRVQAEGHVIGNHTYTHPLDLRQDSEQQVTEELESCERIIERDTGRRSYLFRPPRGFTDGEVFSLAEACGYRTILWTVCADNHTAPTPELMAKRVLSRVEPGAIILLHDGYLLSRKRDVAATQLIIAGLEARGYRFVTVPELLSLGRRHRIFHR